MISNLTEILIELKSINASLGNEYSWIITLISTLSGVFVGGYLTYFYQVKGKLRIYANKIDFIYFKSKKKSFENLGNQNQKVELNENPEFGIVEINIDVINTKLVSENIREIYLIIEVNKKIKKRLTLLDRATFKFSQGKTTKDVLKIINIKSKTINNYILETNFGNEIIELLKEKHKVFISFRNQNNKLKKILLEKNN
jgi:hypothetical protein